MKTTHVAIVLLAAACVVMSPATPAAELRPGIAFQWEYRVLTEEQIVGLAKRDLAAGLNKLGEEGWELATAGTHYIFKRPRDLAQKQAAEIRHWIAAAESDVEAWKDRVAWSERMLKKGYLTEKLVEAERAQLRQAESVLDIARRALKNLPSDAKGPEQKDSRPEK